MNSPCLSCIRVKHPEDCENKSCALWQRWFLSQWRKHHNYYLKCGAINPPREVK